MADSTIQVQNTGAVRTIALNRPDCLNACNADLLVALEKALRDAERDAGVRCLVLTGMGRAFCSGQDLAEVAERYASPDPIELGARLRKHYHPVVFRIRTMEKPVLAAVNGVAAGAGCSLALVCDFRIAAESATFLEAFIHVGLVPDCASTFMLPRLVGVGRALELAMTGRRVTADEALRIGLVNLVVPDADLASQAVKMAERLASLPPRGLALTKRAINAAWTSDLEQQLEYEAQLQTAAGQTADHREGVRAFLDKRPPQFKGH